MFVVTPFVVETLLNCFGKIAQSRQVSPWWSACLPSTPTIPVIIPLEANYSLS